MKVSLGTFLRTGNLGELRQGISKDEVQALLGPPDDTGGTSRKHHQPSIFLYGAVELNFSQTAPQGLTSIFWEAGEKGEFWLPPSCEIVDWAFTPAWTFAQAEDYLRDNHLSFEHRDAPSSTESLPWLFLSSGVQIAFYGDLLYSVYGGGRL